MCPLLVLASEVFIVFLFPGLCRESVSRMEPVGGNVAADTESC